VSAADPREVRRQTLREVLDVLDADMHAQHVEARADIESGKLAEPMAIFMAGMRTGTIAAARGLVRRMLDEE
jgi:hypothetical protein